MATLKFGIILLCISISILPPKIASASKILFVIGLGTHSHRVAMQPLATKLAERGHEVTFLSSIKPQTPNPKITEVYLEQAMQRVHDDDAGAIDDSVLRKLESKYNDHLFDGEVLWDLILNQYIAFLNDQDFMEFVTTHRFDIIISDYNMKELMHAIAFKLNSKIIWFYTAGAQFMLDFEILGLPIESSWLPDLTLGSPYKFIPNHFYYAINSLHWYFSFYWNFLPRCNKVLEEGLGQGISSVDELFTKVDLVFVNEHFSYGYPRSLPPFVIPVAGMQFEKSSAEVQALPKDIAKFVDKYPKFIYFSLGSIVRISSLPKYLQDAIFETIKSFQDVGFLLKWDGKVPENLPENILAMGWFPQQDILAHPKCSGFVTQGGALSFQQSLRHHVPIIGIPAWWDQSNIARRAVELGIGVHLELPDITEETLTSALNKILLNASYSENMKLISKRSEDRPMSPVDTAVWWTEYVLKHDSAHLKSPAMKQHWWQRRLLDFWTLSFLILGLVLYICLKIILKIINYYQSFAFRTQSSPVNKLKLQ